VSSEKGCCPRSLGIWGCRVALGRTLPLCQSISSSFRGRKTDDLAAVTLRHDQARWLPASPSKCSRKGPPKFGCTNARPSKCWALSQNMPASSSGQLHPQDPTFSSHKSLSSAGAWSVEREYSYTHSCGVCTTCKVAGFLGGVSGQWGTQVSHCRSRELCFHGVCKRKREREPVRPQARAEGACPHRPPLHTAPSPSSLQPASPGSASTRSCTPPGPWPSGQTGHGLTPTRTPAQLLQVPEALTRFSVSS